MASQKQIRKMVKEIGLLMQAEDRPDMLFRLALVVSQAGSLAKYITHDPQLNPGARPHGSPSDKELAFGQLLVQVLGLGIAMGIDIPNAYTLAFNNWQERDWRKVTPQSSGQIITGISAGYPGEASGKAFVDPSAKRLAEFHAGVLVVRHFRPKDTAFLPEFGVAAIVTDYGTKTCHAATVSRDRGIPCVVGTGDATTRITHGQKVRVRAVGQEGVVFPDG